MVCALINRKRTLMRGCGSAKVDATSTFVNPSSARTESATG